MPRLFVRAALAALIGLSVAAPAGAQPMDPRLFRIEPRCVEAWAVPQVLMSRGYRDARIVKWLDAERVQVIAVSGDSQFLLTFNLCRSEVEDRERL